MSPFSKMPCRLLMVTFGFQKVALGAPLLSELISAALLAVKELDSNMR